MQVHGMYMSKNGYKMTERILKFPLFFVSEFSPIRMIKRARTSKLILSFFTQFFYIPCVQKCSPSGHFVYNHHKQL